MATDKRDLLLVIKGRDQGAKDALDGVAEAADGAKEDLGDMQAGLKKLDGQIAVSTKKVDDLRKEINKSGDLGLIKDLERAQRELNKLTKQRKILIPVELDVDKDAIGDAGGDGAAAFSVGFAQKIGPLIARGPMSPALLGAVAAAAPAIATTLSAAVTAGVGVGAVGAGIALAARDPAVKKAGSELGRAILGDLETAAEPFVLQTLGALRDVRGEWAQILPDIEDTFAAGAAYVRPLTAAVTGFVRGVLPGVRDAVRNAQPIIDVLKDELPDVGRAIGDALSDLSDDSQETAASLRLLLDLAEQGIGGTAKAIDLLQESLKYTNIWWNLYRDATAEATEVTRVSTVTYEDLRGSLVSSEHAVEAMAERQEILNNTMSEGVDFAGGLKEALDILSGGTLDLREAQRGVQQAIDDAQTSLKENGKTLNINTQKGRDNAASLDSIADAYRTEADAVYRSTEATKGADAATAAATQTLEIGRQKLIETYLQFDNNKARAEAYADSVLGIPEEWKTEIKSNTDGQKRKVTTLREELAALEGVYSFTVRQNFLTFGKPYSGVTGIGGSTNRGYADGGYVDMPGPKGKDAGFIAAGPGEYVLDAGDVDKLGGPRAIDAWRRNLDRGLMAYRAPAGGGGGGSGGGGGRLEVVARWAGGGGPLGDLGAALTRFIRLDVVEQGGGDVQTAYGRRRP